MYKHDQLPGKNKPHYMRPNENRRKSLFKRVRGKPSNAASRDTLAYMLGLILSRALQIVLVVLLMVGFLAFGIGSGMLIGYITTTQPVTASQLNTYSQTTRILDSAGSEIAILTGAENINRQFIPFGQVKHTYIDEAFMAIEDERYEEHVGIDPKRIFSAVLSALSNNGNATHGGSTITQQTVKLVSGAQDRSIQRKVQEWYNSIRLEQQKSKDEIMELYLNLVPMGNSYVGVQSAAKGYFNKDAAELDLVESAFLAGIPNRPSSYNPRTESGRRNALRRMRIVLGKMHDLGMIETAQYEEALDTEPQFRSEDELITANQVNSYFADYVIGQVIEDLITYRGYSRTLAEITVYNQGLQIETTMDAKVQADMEAVFRDESFFVKRPESIANLPAKPQGSMVVVENHPNPGQIKGMVGGFGEKTGNFVLNRAVSARRQPGSSIKPLAIYGPGIDTGLISAASTFVDKAYYLDDKNPTKVWPRNSGSSYRGKLTVREAVKYSINTIAVLLYTELIGPDIMLPYLEQLGMPRPTERYPSTALGSFNQGMTTLEMAGAYAVWANHGLYTKPYAYTRVLSANGEVLLENKPEFKQVFKPETAFIMTDIMQGVMTPGGTANRNAVPNMPTGGKTGTTDDNADKWLIGFTPYYSAAVWYGYDNRLGKTEIPSPDRNNARGIWTEVMTRIHEGLPHRDFERPATVEEHTICPASGLLATSRCPNPRKEYFVPGAAANPDRYCNVHGASSATGQTNPRTTTGNTTAPRGNSPTTRDTASATKEPAPTTKSPTTAATKDTKPEPSKKAASTTDG